MQLPFVNRAHKTKSYKVPRIFIMKKNVLRSLIAATTLATSMSTLAASDEATSLITLTVPETIEIAQLNPIPLNAVAGSDVTNSDAFCIAGTGFGTFSIKFESAAGGASEFLLSDGDPTTPETVPYTVEFENGLSGSGYSPMTAANDDAGNTRQAASCSGADNAQVRVTVAQAAWEALKGTNYTDTLTVTVTSD